MNSIERLVAGFVFVSMALNAGTVNVGLLSFDAIQPGLNAFNIANYTGDPGLGGFALGPPDFPVYSMVSFLSSSLTVQEGNASQLIFLGDLAPGPFSSTVLEFPDTAQISMAIFTATLSQTLLTLADGSTITVSPDIKISLLPSIGASLTGGDFVLLDAADVPEASSMMLVAAGVLAIGAFCRLGAKRGLGL